MFQNVGGKLKSVAYVLFGLMVALYVIIGLVMMITGDGDGVTVVVGLLIIAIGFVTAWVSALFMLGYARLVENTDRMAAVMAQQHKQATTVCCPECGSEKSGPFCVKCGHHFE